ncbi:MAG: ATP-dependent helicase Lhr and Lhr-like helicase [Frankiales bacterium]|nr:ATP-dependent helicase Lhr and Lhr-like helicase [Frankiales bacterium]
MTPPVPPVPPSALERFSPATRAWFSAAFAEPTAAQEGAWTAASDGKDALVVAPTGSGKTLAAFLWSLDRLSVEPAPDDALRRCRVLYVSPLKALAFDVERNLRAPLAGIRQAATRLGSPVPDITVGMRTGDTPVEERRMFAKKPPDILITTPESLFLLLTSAARQALLGVETVIIDEVHAVAATKRGAHLALSLERLDHLVGQAGGRRPQRLGLSATVRPVDEVARFLGGAADVMVVQPPSAKVITVEVVVPVEDMADPGTTALDPDQPLALPGDPLPGSAPKPSIWPAVEERIVDLVEQHSSTIVFANSRRLAERLTARLNEIAEQRAEAAAPRPVLLEPLRLPRTPAELMAQAGTSYGAPSALARAHHGSVSREQRKEIEEALKRGELPAVVATSSLELGIDMGAVDLVIQVESPPSVASGLQRIGRAGHQVGAESHGVMFPKYRGDLLPAAVVAERMAAGQIEAMRYPRLPLDVLAQQIVAMVALDTWTVEDLATVVRRAAPFATLPDSVLEATLDMLAGRYPSDEFAELRPRLVWDRVAGTLTGRPGAQRLAVTSGGTIPDRGLFGVFLVGEKGSRVGELDEEMVYESRVGDVFTLGSSSWRIEDITHDRVLVTPAPGVPGKLPFWHGDTLGRPLELGRAMGEFVRTLTALAPAAARHRLSAAGLDVWAADNLLRHLDEQRQATGHLPDDRTIVVERFRDELGDWRVALHSPYGAQVHAPWALAISGRLRERYGVDVQAMHSDDGIVLRLPDTEAEPPPDLAIFEPDEIEALVTAEVGGSALFSSRFRECAGRALLLPRRSPGKRTPLWQQRQRSAQLLSVASSHPTFPIVLETMRECLQDVFDVPGLVTLMRRLAAREVRIVEVDTPVPSPYARSLLFGYVAAFLYEGDAPLAERRAAALSVDPSLLADLLGQAELRELVDPDALAEVERELQRLPVDRHVRDMEGTADLLRMLGDLTTAEALARGSDPHWLEQLEAGRRAVRVRIAGEERWISIEDSGRFRDALGTSLPVGVPEAFTEPVADPVGDLVSRFARTHGPFVAADVAARFGLGTAVVSAALGRLAGQGRVAHGEFRPGGSGTEWCDAGVLRAIRRRSLAKLRREIEPVPAVTLGRFVPSWQGVGAAAGHGQGALLRAIEQLQGAIVPASTLETMVLASRVTDYAPSMLDELTAAGEVLWAGAGSLPGEDGWVSLALADTASLVLPSAPGSSTEITPLHAAVLGALGQGQAMFFRGLAEAVAQDETLPVPDDGALAQAVWDLVWAGELTNDTLAPLRSRLGAARPGTRTGRSGGASRSRYGRPRPSLPLRSGPPATAGRWSRLPARENDPTRRLHALAEALLDRHGVVTRDAVAAEGVTGGFAAVYRVLRAFEDAGRCRRGYFVEGLGAAQFALPGAVDRLRGCVPPVAPQAGGAGSVPAPAGPSPWAVPVPGGWRERVRTRADAAEPSRALLLAATDPANPYGAALPWPDRADVAGVEAPLPGSAVVDLSDGAPAGKAARTGSGHRPGRKNGALVVLVDGALTLYVERGGKSLLTFSSDPARLQPAVDTLALAVHDGVLGKLAVERADGAGLLSSGPASPVAEALRAAGFHATPRGLRLRL